ncbi:MAG TPA: A/G-specific adenine glycosylase [Actinomycetota bacterium]
MGRKALLRWYEPRRHAYPWRTTRDPYRILVSEMMLQQTQASRVAPAFASFLARFPTVHSLAGARLRDVVTAWQGLGYNRRAVALWGAARTIVRDHGGRIPDDPVEMEMLAGIGPYTAAAVSSVAFGSAVAAVDTNMRRIVARFFLGAEPDGVSPREIRALADAWLDRRDPGGWNQAVMDLGRERCRPRPRCGACPLKAQCRFVAEGRQPASARRRQPAFEGSFRQLRGAVVRTLIDRESASLADLSGETGVPLERVGEAVSVLAADGLLVAGPAARAGRPGGRVRLPG